MPSIQRVPHIMAKEILRQLTGESDHSGRTLFHRQSKQGRCHDPELFGKLEAPCEGCIANGEMDHFQVFQKAI
jgi:hypothetical protein